MRRLLIAALLAAGCADGVTAPPDGLPVTLREAITDATRVPAVAAQGDSIVGRIPAGGWCTAANASAGWRQGRVVVTVTDSMTGNPCPAVIAVYDHVATVRPAPHGSYEVDVVSRVVDLDRRVSSRVVASAVVTVP